jgi:transcriptional regulator with XRE-family HTH domain
MTSATSLTFGPLLKRARRAARLTQAQLAEAAGFSVVYISMLERGARQPQLSTLALLADALDLSTGARTALERAAQAPSASFARRSEPDDAIPPAPSGSFQVVARDASERPGRVGPLVTPIRTGGRCPRRSGRVHP